MLSRRALFTLHSSLFILLAVACAPIRPVEPLPPPAPTPVVAYPPVSLPADDASHDYLTEWWYYTGHLWAGSGEQYGFELVTFQAIRGELPVAYVGHFAITDRQRAAFQYAERSAFTQRQAMTNGFDLQVGSWRMRGSDGRDHLQADMDGYAIDLALQSVKPPVLHEIDGLISFGAAGDSYYYSRSRIDVQGVMMDHGRQVPVTGEAWFDHQWGNFLVLGGGWDWFSVQLDDGTDLMLNLVRDEAGVVHLAYGTLVDAAGQGRHVAAGEFSVEPLASWTSPRTGARYPSGWNVRLREPPMDLRFEPVIQDQELDVRGSTGNTYWEGATTVRGTAQGRQITGRAYVELTGYGP